MRNGTGLMVIAAIGCVGLAACSSSPPLQRQASTASSVTQPSPTNTSRSAGASTTAAATEPCVGLSICPTRPPDAEGNPACYYRDGWDADPSGSGINVYYFRDPSSTSDPEQVTADVRLKDGTNASQIAGIDPGQPVNQFRFPGIDKAAVREVLLTISTGRCFVIGPSGS